MQYTKLIFSNVIVFVDPSPTVVGNSMVKSIYVT